MGPTLKKLLPHFIAYLVLLVIAFVRFAPIVFEGKELQQGDNIQAFGMQAEMRQIKSKTGDYPLWTNAAFAGMPGFQILYPTSNAIQYVAKTFLLGNGMAPPHTGILLMMAGFYLLLVVLGVDWRLGMVGAVGFGLAANHLGLAEAGHSTKIVAMAYMAPALAGILLTFRGKYWLGGGLTALFMALQLYANHVQITYYFLLTLLVFGVVYFMEAFKNKTLPGFFKATLITAATIALAFATNTGRLWTTWEYAQETIRGQSELTQKGDSSGSTSEEGGLSKGYAFAWSYGKLETFNLLIPNYVGGSSSEGFASDPNSATMAALRQMQNTQQATELAQQATHYWGAQPFTSGGVYLGAVFVLLFFLGAFLVKTPIRWYVVASVALAILLSWGKNFEAFNYFVFDHLPMYNKFRDVKTVLGTANMLVILLAILGLKAFFDKSVGQEEKKKALFFAGGMAGGLVLLGLLISTGLDYVKEGENFPAALTAALAEDRAGLLYADAFRSLIFIGCGFAVLWFWLKSRFVAGWMVLGIGALALLDIWGVGNRFIGPEDFISKTDKNRITAPTAADGQIKQDPGPYYRVADFRGNPFTSAITSYHHLSMGGYHAAKLMRYQEMVERYLGDPGKYPHIYGMFNAKYFITNDQVFPNQEALGNAWFVKSFDVVENGDAEITALDSMDFREKAVIQKSFLGTLEGFTPQFDSTASISLARYHPDTLTYSYTAASDQLAVFSEMYYPPAKGWGMYLDGQKTGDFTKANFTLRAARLPAGTHELKMVFSPKSYHTGEMVSLIASLLVLGLAVWGIYWFAKNHQIPEAANLPAVEAVVKSKPKKTIPKKRK